MTIFTQKLNKFLAVSGPESGHSNMLFRADPFFPYVAYLMCEHVRPRVKVAKSPKEAGVSAGVHLVQGVKRNLVENKDILNYQEEKFLTGDNSQIHIQVILYRPEQAVSAPED